jgi:hypothetical protein
MVRVSHAGNAECSGLRFFVIMIGAVGSPDTTLMTVSYLPHCHGEMTEANSQTYMYIFG